MVTPDAHLSSPGDMNGCRLCSVDWLQNASKQFDRTDFRQTHLLGRHCLCQSHRLRFKTEAIARYTNRPKGCLNFYCEIIKII